MKDWCRWCRPSLFVPLIALLALAGMVGGCATVQADVTERTNAELEAAGLAAVSVDQVSYRNVTLSGPASLEAEAVGLVDGLEATHEVSYSPSGAEVSTGADSEAVASISVTAAVAAGQVTLSGDVPDEATREGLVEAATAAFGAQAVVDELSVSGVDAGDELSAAAGDLAMLLGAFPGRFTDGEARLENTQLTVTGRVADDQAAQDLNALVDGFTGATVEAAFDPPTATTIDGTIDATAVIGDGAVTLSGVVPDEATSGTLTSAAETGFGPANVTSELEVAAGTGTTPELDAAAAALASLLAGPASGLTDATITLQGTDLIVEGTAADPGALADIEGSIAGLAGVNASAAVGADPQGTVDALGELLTLEPINFESGSDVITADSEAILLTAVDYLSAAFTADPDLSVEIGGHTDDQGDAAFNEDLSSRRASAVLQFLTDNGVPAAGLTAVGYGESQPVADNSTSDGRAENRRIEFTIVEG